MTLNDPLQSRHETAAILKISLRTLDRLPDLTRIRIGQRRIAYRRSDIEAWIAAQADQARAA